MSRSCVGHVFTNRTANGFGTFGSDDAAADVAVVVVDGVDGINLIGVVVFVFAFEIVALIGVGVIGA